VTKTDENYSKTEVLSEIKAVFNTSDFLFVIEFSKKKRLALT
jgi:hypothetical protein